MPDDADAKELAAFNGWLAKGAFSIGDPEASTMTLLLDGEERTFFAKRDDDDDEDEPTPASKGTDQPDPLVAVLAALLQEQNELLGKVNKVKKEKPMTKTATKTPADFTKKVAEIKARDGCDGMEAMSKARQEDPVAFAMYQHGPKFPDVPSADAITKAASSKAAVQAFEDKCSEIFKRDGCSRTQALSRAREEHPDEFKKAFRS